MTQHPSIITGAAPAALVEPSQLDSYLIVDDTFDDVTEVLTVLQERSRFSREVQS